MDPMFHRYEMFLGVGRSTIMLFTSTRISFFRLCFFISCRYLVVFIVFCGFSMNFVITSSE